MLDELFLKIADVNIFVLTFFTKNFVTDAVELSITSLRREKKKLSPCSTTNHLKIVYIFINVHCCIYVEFHKNYMNIYRIINISFKNGNFLHLFVYI